MRYLPLLAAAALFAAPAKADKFWMSDPEAQQNAPEGSVPDYIEGVLLSEDETTYTVRVEGGELVLQKEDVFKVEKDDLTAESIREAEESSRDELAEADVARISAQRSARESRAAEASARRDARAAEASMTAEVVPMQSPAPTFDPVLGVFGGEPSHAALLRDTQLAWNLTQDRRYLKLLRQLRRLR